MYFGCCCKLKLALFIDYIIEIVIDHGVTFGENEVVCVFVKCLLLSDSVTGFMLLSL